MERMQEFIKVFNSVCGRHSKGVVFSDFAEIAACTMHQLPYHVGILPKDEEYHRMENKYLDTVKRYDREELDQFVKLYGIATVALDETPEDFLGPVFMNLEISNDRAGQFFTPNSVSAMMAKMTLAEAGKVISERGVVTVSDPAAGAGGMLIHAANAIRDQGFDPRGTMWFQAIDIDRTCFNMAYFQLSALGLSGEVIHGNTLSMEFRETRPTPQLRISQLGIYKTGSRQACDAPAPSAVHRGRAILNEIRNTPARETERASKAREPVAIGQQFKLDLDI